MLFLMIYHKFWGIAFCMCFCNLNVSHRNMIFTIIEPNAYERYLLNFLVTYSIIFFCFHTYDINFHALSNDISQVLGNSFSVCVFAT